MKRTADFFDYVLDLGDVPRTGWFSTGVADVESVAEHSYGVAAFVIGLSDLVSEEIDLSRALQIAVLHDLGEAIVGDIPKPVKRLIGEASVSIAERKAFVEIVGGSEKMVEMYDAYVARSCPESRLVKAADTIQMLSMALRYHQRGADVSRFFDTDRSYDAYGFPEVEAMISSLFEKYWEAGGSRWTDGN